MKLIIACDKNGGIGYQNKLPWNKIQGDLPRFKKLTEGQVVVMGKHTWESLPVKPLPNRLNIVITTTESMKSITVPKKVIVTDDIERVKDYDIWLIGGAKLVESCWSRINEIHLTKTFAEYTCDRFIDLLYLEQNFICEHTETYADHTYTIWKRR